MERIVSPTVESHGILLPHSLAGGGLPIERAYLPEAVTASTSPTSVQTVQPASFAQTQAVTELAQDSYSDGTEVAAELDVEPEMKSVESPALTRIGEQGQLKPTILTASGYVAIREPAEPPRQSKPPVESVSCLSVDETDTLQLMYGLQSDDDEVREAAASELKSRGFSEVHLELARQLTCAKADVRAKLAERLPGTSGIDARLWLTWLMRDESADVRLAAIGVLATTGQSESFRRAMEIARQDRDPRIRKLVDQFDKQQKANR
jgi:hypothetical protein